METRAPYVLVGAFVVVLLAGLVAAVIWFAQVQFRQQATYYDIYFTGSVTGLSTGSTVRYNGVPVGRVADIKLNPVDPNRVRVTAELQPDVAIKTDTIASLEMQSIAGGVDVDLSGGTAQSPPLTRKPDQRYPVIASQPSELQQVVSAAPELLARALTLSAELSDVLSPKNRQNLSATLDNLRKVSDTAANHSKDIDSAIGNGTASLADLRQTLDNANAILAALKSLIAPNGNLDNLMRSANETSQHLSDLAQRLDTIVAENQPQLKEFSHAGLEQIQQLVSETQALVTQLSQLADAFQRDPSRILYGDQRQGYRPP